MRKIFHTILVFSLLMIVGCVQKSEDKAHLVVSDALQIPLVERVDSAMTGKEFIKSVDTALFVDREAAIAREILAGNVPDFMRHFKTVEYQVKGADSVLHTVRINTLPDYLMVGTDSDFVRMPMGPLTAQMIADSLHCTMPTALLVDKIAEASEGRIDPFPFRPVGIRNVYSYTFEDSNNAINALFKAKGYKFGQMVSGLKKDVILTSKIAGDTTRRNHVTIYGWHYPDGTRIQRSNNIHVNFYVDYSHGIRLLDRTAYVDGDSVDIPTALTDSVQFRLFSDEETPMIKATYAGDVLHGGLRW